MLTPLDVGLRRAMEGEYRTLSGIDVDVGRCGMREVKTR